VEVCTDASSGARWLTPDRREWLRFKPALTFGAMPLALRRGIFPTAGLQSTDDLYELALGELASLFG